MRERCSELGRNLEVLDKRLPKLLRPVVELELRPLSLTRGGVKGEPFSESAPVDPMVEERNLLRAGGAKAGEDCEDRADVVESFLSIPGAANPNDDLTRALVCEGDGSGEGVPFS